MTSANQTPRIITITTPGPQGIQGPPGFASSGSNTYLGDQIITGSILISGSIVPDVGIGETTSSFSLGSETAAWKDIYVSEGSIKFIKSGSSTVTLSAANGGISVDGGSVISADGVSGQFITSKSLDTNTTVKDYNNSLLMGPIDIESNKEIVVEEGSDLTIFGDIENVVPDDLSIRSLNVNLNTSLNGVLAVANDINASGKIESSFYINNKTINSDIFINDNESALIIGETISVEEDKEIVVEDDSELTIFGDIETPNLVDNSLFATSASFSNTSSYAASASFADTSSYAASASFSNTSSYAVTASYVLNSSCSCTPFPYSGSAIITGSLVVNNGTNNIVNTSNYQLIDSNGATSVDWGNKTLKDGNRTSVDWTNRYLQSANANELSIDWESRILYANDGTTPHLDWSNPSYMQFPNISGSPITNVLGIDGAGRVYYTASSAIGGGTSNSPGGVEGSIQFNNSIGDFGGTQKFTYNASSHSISLTEFQPAPFGITENKGQYSILQGREGKVLGDYGVSLVGAYALNTASVAIGYGVAASGSYQVAVGRPNTLNNTSSIFIVGVGSNKDGFTVEADSSIRAHVTIPVNSTNPTNPKSGSMYVFESGSNYYINVYVGGRWRSASLF